MDERDLSTEAKKKGWGGVEGSDIPSGGCFPGGFVFFGGVLGVMGGFLGRGRRFLFSISFFFFLFFLFFLSFSGLQAGCIYFFAAIALPSNIVLAKYPDS